MEIFDYDNILLLPRKCRVESRSECDATVEFGGRRFAQQCWTPKIQSFMQARTARLTRSRRQNAAALPGATQAGLRPSSMRRRLKRQVRIYPHQGACWPSKIFCV